MSLAEVARHLAGSDHEDFPTSDSVVTVPDNSAVDKAELAMIDACRKGLAVYTAEDFRPEHFFAPGIYVRLLFRPKGTQIVGHAHKHAHLSIVLQGWLRVYSNGRHKDIMGPSKPFLTPAGARKATRAMRDTMLLTIHATDERDVSKLEDELVVKSAAFLEFEAEQRLKLANRPEIAQENLATT